MSIELVLADPHPVLLEGLSQVFQACPEFVVKACASTGDDALAAVKKHEPDILVMDVSLANRSGWSVLEDMKQHHARTRPVVFTDAPIDDVMRVIDSGVPGLVGKDKSRQELARCIQAVHAGHKWLDRDLTLKTMSVLMAWYNSPGHALQMPVASLQAGFGFAAETRQRAWQMLHNQGAVALVDQVTLAEITPQLLAPLTGVACACYQKLQAH
jgi:DNA-binding NarL/FixJ family response regulator